MYDPHRASAVVSGAAYGNMTYGINVQSCHIITTPGKSCTESVDTLSSSTMPGKATENCVSGSSKKGSIQQVDEAAFRKQSILSKPGLFLVHST